MKFYYSQFSYKIEYFIILEKIIFKDIFKKNSIGVNYYIHYSF